jgi:hypothetical protein
MNTGLVVVGITPGGYLIEDLGIRVPHQVAVTISPDQAVKSRDLYRAINQQRIFKLDGTVGLALSADPVVLESPIEVRQLKEELNQSSAKNVELERSLKEMQQKLDTILGVLSKRETSNNAPLATSVTERRSTTDEDLDLSLDELCAEIPVFIPSTIKPEGAETRIEKNTDVAGGGEVAAAANKLRKFKKR